MSDHTPPESSMPTNDPSLAPGEQSGSHAGAKPKAEKPYEAIPTVYQIQKGGLEIQGAPISAYIDCGPNKNIRMTYDLLVNYSNLVGKRIQYLTHRRSEEHNTNIELESILQDVSPRLKKWSDYLEHGGPRPDQSEVLTQEDIDLYYYLVTDEITQRGAMLGYETFLHFTRGHFQPHAERFSSSMRRGIETPYNRWLYTSTRDERKIIEDLERWEKVRVDLTQALTGRSPRALLRSNWGLCVGSMFRRDSMELKLPMQILYELEQSTEPVIRRYRDAHDGHIQNVTDFLVNIDDPRERVIAIEAYHQAIQKAVAKRFHPKADELINAYIDRKKETWEEKHWVESAKANKEKLESKKELTEEQKKIPTQFRTELTGIRDFLLGKQSGEAGEISGGITTRVLALQDAIGAYRTYSTLPENVLDGPQGLRTLLAGAQQKVDNGGFNLAGGAVVVPAHIQRLNDNVARCTAALDAFDGNLPPYDAMALNKKADTKTALLTALEKATTDYNTSLNKVYEDAVKERDRIQGRIDAVTKELDVRSKAVETAYKFIEVDNPEFLIKVTDLRERINHFIAHPPAEFNTPQNIAEFTAQSASLDRVIDFMTNHLLNDLRRNPGQLIDAYVTRPSVRDYQLDRNLFEAMLLPFEEHIRKYEDILTGHLDEDTGTRIKALELELRIIGADNTEGTLEKGKSRVLVEGETGRALTDLKAIASGQPVERDLSAIITDILCNHKDIIEAKEAGDSLGLNDPLLWRRVFSNKFILQSAVEWYLSRGGLRLPDPVHAWSMDLDPPPAAAGAAAPDLRFRNLVIERMASDHIELARFLTFIVEKRLQDAANPLQVQAGVIEAEQAGGQPPGTITYAPHPRNGIAATIFAVEDDNDFNRRMRTREDIYYRFRSTEGEIDNIGDVRFMDPNVGGLREGIVGSVVTSNLDPVTIDLGGRPRQFRLRTLFRRTAWGNLRFDIQMQADPSLDGLHIPQFNGDFNRRWVDLGSHRYNDYAEFQTEIRNLLPHAGALALANPILDNFRDTISQHVLKSLGEYFINLTPVQKLNWRRFPDVPITPPELINAGFSRISLNQSGLIELLRADGTRTSLDSALEGEYDIPNPVAIGGISHRRMNRDEIDQLLQTIGRQIFNMTGRGEGIIW